MMGSRVIRRSSYAAVFICLLAAGCDTPEPLPEPTAQQPEQSPTPAQQIVQLEQKIATSPGQFDYGARNELRHLYLGLAQESLMKSMAQCNDILWHNPMDQYTLNCLLDWQIAEGGKFKDAMRARNLALGLAEQSSDMPFLAAACWITAGDAAATADEAALYYGRVISSTDPKMITYVTIAKDHHARRQPATASPPQNPEQDDALH